ncbi:hypothetical protein [Halorussus pelagicus]|uniref:hypothetical protein n=1 Tax=Halorussus pelagicus TaxID=2505977 RepID=UPI000FFC2E15|nr:hypothetical protein [Halorussus pelagicus]
MTPPDTDSQEDTPEQITTALEDSSDSQLRDIIHYAQQLLREHPPLTDAIESRYGEPVHVEDHGAYTTVVVKHPDETGEEHGLFAYRVKWQPNIDDEGGQYRWHYLGKVHDETEDNDDG